MKKQLIYLLLCCASVAWAQDFSGYWEGTWSSGIYGTSDDMELEISQAGTDLSGYLRRFVDGYGQTFHNTTLYDAYVSNGKATARAKLYSAGSWYVLQYSQATVSGNTMSGDYYITEDGEPYDLGTFYVTRTSTALPAPTGVSASDGIYEDKVRVTWNSAEGSSTYRVYRSTSPTGTKTALGSWQTSLSYDDTGASYGTTYYYFVQGSAPSGGSYIQSDYSAYNTGYVGSYAPINVSATDGAYSDKVRITWEGRGSASYFRVYRSTSLSGTQTAVSSWQTSTTFDDTTASVGTVYFYFVRPAADSSGAQAGAYSDGESGYKAPAPPTGVSATDGTDSDQVLITWNSSTGASRYRVYRAESPSGTKTAISSWRTTRSFSDTTAITGETYYYFVQSATDASGADAVGYSSYNAGYRGFPEPTGISADDGVFGYKVGISWNGVSGASYYRVYRATSAAGTKAVLGSWQTSLSYNDTSASPGVLYYYFVRAASDSSGSGAGEYSAYNTGYRALAAPTSVYASNGTYADKVHVSWGSVSGATYYHVYRAASADGPKTALGTWQTSLSFDDTDTVYGTTNWYFVQAATSSSGANPGEYSIPDPGTPAMSYSGGAGTIADPYLIADSDDLMDLRSHTDHYDNHFRLIGHVDLSGYTFADAVIAGSGSGEFTGSFDGCGYIISNLTINSTGDYLGLFGTLEGAARNLTLLGVDINGGTDSDHCGALCGKLSGGAVSNCYVDAEVVGDDYIGGLVGYANYSPAIDRCSVLGSVSGQYEAGGLVGCLSGGTLNGCMVDVVITALDNADYIGGVCGYNFGVISNTSSEGTVNCNYNADYVGGFCGRNNEWIFESYSAGNVQDGTSGNWRGGFVGYNDGSEGIVNCYSTGDVSGGSYSDDFGGFCGMNGAVISNCYSVGSVSGSYNNSGFNNFGASLVANCFWDTQVSGVSFSEGGIGKTTDLMQAQSTFANAGWDFSNVWKIEPNEYPKLRSFEPPPPPVVALDISGPEFLVEGMTGTVTCAAAFSDESAPGQTIEITVSNTNRLTATKTVYVTVAQPAVSVGLSAVDDDLFNGASNALVTFTCGDVVESISIRVQDNEGGTFRFGETSVSAGSGVGFVPLNIRRDCADGFASVDYRTEDGSLVGGTDYLHVSGTASFAAGETNQAILVPVVSDQAGSFRVVLENPSEYAGLGPESVATLSLAPVMPRHLIADTFSAYDMDTADLDGDGYPDVLGADFYSDEIAWWKNGVGDGAPWEKESISSTFDGATAVCAVDFDRDGDLDVLGGADWGAEISWWENAEGSATSWIKHSVGTNAYNLQDVCPGDLDDDGDMDVVGCRWSEGVWWWQNLGGATWTNFLIDDSLDGMCEICCEDMDGDGDTDVLGAAWNDGEYAWWENSAGDGSVWTKHTIGTGLAGSRSVFPCDLDGDGDQDVVSAAFSAGDVSWWENSTGNGSVWIKHLLSDDVDDARSVCAADINGDGTLDVIAAAALADQVVWWENAGTNETWPKYIIDDLFDGAGTIAPVDLDVDGDMDIAGTSALNDQIVWWENDRSAGALNPIVPGSLPEGGTNTAWYCLPSPATADADLLVYSLLSSRLVVPATVSVTGGQQIVSFDVWAVDDDLANGNQAVGFSVTYAGNSCTGSVLVLDNDDADNDRLPDDWEQAYFEGVTYCIANADTDGDGQSNLQEYVFGTNPTNKLDANVLELKDGSLNLRACEKRWYIIEGTDDLLNPNWMVLGRFFGSDTNLTLLDPDATLLDSQYYRIKADVMPNDPATFDTDGDGMMDAEDSSPFSKDSDGDGMPDDWESRYSTGSAGSDSDSDGYSDYAEYVFGTLPNDDTSCLFWSVGEDGVRVGTTSNRIYWIDYKPSLTVPWQVWKRFGGDGSTNIFNRMPSGDAGYFRVRATSGNVLQMQE